jgi:uncharacterized protein
VRAISEEDVRLRIARDNPWWGRDDYVVPESTSPRRAYFTSFCELALNYDVKRAAILLGPRRVGKTFMLKQLIAKANNEGIDPQGILYVSIDTPVYSGIFLEKFLSFLPAQKSERLLVIFDEIQYLRGWEVHLKDLVDTYPNIKFVASGSAAAGGSRLPARADREHRDARAGGTPQSGGGRGFAAASSRAYHTFTSHGRVVG